jgi:hypothetical protein
VPVAFSREACVLIDPHGEGEAAALGEMFHDRRGERGALPETHALREIAAVVRHGHREAQEVEFGVRLSAAFLEDRLLAIDLRFDRGLRFFGGNDIAEFEQAAQAARNGAPVFSIVAADAPDGAG